MECGKCAPRDRPKVSSGQKVPDLRGKDTVIKNVPDGKEIFLQTVPDKDMLAQRFHL